MVVKVSIGFLTKSSDIDLASTVQAIITGVTGNPGFQPPPTLPTLADCQTALDQFNAAVQAALDGGLTLTAIKNAKRADLVALIRQLSNYVQAQCGGDLAVLMSSGFPIQKPTRTPASVLPPPAQVTVTAGPRTGELLAVAAPVAGAAAYNWKLADAAKPDVTLQPDQTTGGRTVFDGLTPGTTYIISANVVGTAGQSDWMPSLPMMAT